MCRQWARCTRSMGSEQRAAIAVTIIGGQTLCPLLTLLFVPVAYSYLAELEATT